MSGSETGGMMMNREQFTLDLQKIPVTPQPASQNILLGYSADGTAVYSVSSGGGGGVGSALAGSGVQHNLSVNVGGSLKKKRGRPRMYGPNGTMTLAVTVAPPHATVPHSTGSFSPQPAAVSHSTATFSPQPAAVPHSTGIFSPQPAAVPHSTRTFSPEPAAVPHSTGTFSPQPATIPQSTWTFSSPPHPPPVSLLGGSDSHSSFKKGRGRPPGPSKKQQMEALGSAGVGFTPHIINVKAGEDVSSKIMSFSQHGPRAVCVLSANGTISNVTLRQAATSGGTATYEGRFDILSLSGSFLLTEVAGQRSRTGGLSVSLAGPDGRVLGGCVAGLLTAASPVQVIAGSFIADGRNEMKTVIQIEPPLSAPPKLLTPGSGAATGASSPPSHGGTCSESSSGGSPINHNTGAFNNTNPQVLSSMPWR